MLRIGHRGAAGYEPENTLSSFRKALELKVDMVEFDIRQCSGGELVVIHDMKVDHTTDGKGYVREMSFSEIRKLDAGKGQKVPAFEEVLDVIDRKVKVNIEIKSEGTAKRVFETISSYVREKNWQWEDFIVSSFNHYELIKFNELTREVRIGAIIAGIPADYVQMAKKVNASSLHPSKEFINKKLVDSAHAGGMQVYVYTLNEPEEIARIRELGADGMFSNFPDRIT